MAEAGEDERERFRAVMELVDRAIDLPASQREAVLGAADVDPVLLAEVRRLLEADASDADLLSGPAGARAPSAFRGLSRVASSDATTGMIVGPFRLGERLGHGGMGEVWTAERIGVDFEQEVALKLLFPDDGRLGGARFRRERQILARLEHPQIARLLDGGIASDGRPWLAMELVTGLSLVDHCVAQRLDVTARLRLFLDVCAAVQFAHQNLVVHRDLKPSNILVDEHGTPKLLDFGIAKLLDDEPSGTALTAKGDRPMTPDYASPEQLRDDVITTASDIWTLGAILHELLTGGRVDRASYDTIKGRPSQCVEAGAASHRPCGLTSTALKKRLEGDLDGIVMKALRPEPKERYGSVDALADDLRRHLDGRPVSARRETAVYLLRSFVRRHRLAVGFMALAIGALCVGLLGTLWQAHRAREEARKAEQTRAFLVDLLEGFDPYQQGGKPVTQHDILVRGEARVDELGDQPEAQAELLRVFAQTWVNMGELERARPTAERALALQRRVLGPRHIEVARTLMILGDIADIPGDWTAAEQAYDEALSIAVEVEGPEGPTALQALGEVAYVARGHGHFAQSEQLYRQQLDRYSRAGGPEGRAALETRGDLAALLCDAGRLEESAAMSREVAAEDAHVFGENHPGTLIVRGNLGRALIELGRYDEAEPLLRDTYERQVTVVGASSPYALNTLRLRARALDGLGRSREALPLFEQIVEKQAALRGPESVEMARTLAPQAVALRHAKRLAEAEVAARRALTLQPPRLGETHTAARLHATLGSVLLDAGRIEEARAELTSALAVQEKVLPPNHPDLLATRLELARADLARGRP